eukprot:scaffold681500_cov57-Prasinocladus_malaysianus.AAC.1
MAKDAIIKQTQNDKKAAADEKKEAEKDLKVKKVELTKSKEAQIDMQAEFDQLKAVAYNALWVSMGPNDQ